MIGISDIAGYLPEDTLSNYERAAALGFDANFIDDKIGISRVTRKRADQDTSDLCCVALDKLCERRQLDLSKIQVLIVCTQNPDFNVPHTSAIVHGKLGLSEQCAAFDFSLGCSGYLYGLSIVESFMRNNEFTHGLFFTADPYSKIIEKEDKDTALLFGDGATVTYITDEPVFTCGRFTFGTKGKDYEKLICRAGKLHMNGRGIFNFAASTVPKDIKKALELNNVSMDDIDRFLIHQGSKYIVDFLSKRLQLPAGKTPFVIGRYGNTVSSSIPFMLEEVLDDTSISRVLLCGFGVGLSWSSTVLFRQ